MELLLFIVRVHYYLNYLTISFLTQVGIVSFADGVKTPNSEDCYNERLALAIPTNIRNMKKFVEAQYADAGKKKN